MINIEISNMDYVASKVLGIFGRMDGAEAEVMNRWEELLDGVVKPECPVDTGYMLSCIHAERNDKGKISGFWYGIHDADCDYAKWFIYAWGGSKDWWTPTIESAKERMGNIFHEVLMERAGL